MRQHGLRAQGRRPFRPKTTSADHRATASPNLLKDLVPPSAPGQILVTDITYIPTSEGFLYLSVVLDLFSRAVLGWILADHLKSSLVVDTLFQTLASGHVLPGVILHSDRGCQYTSSFVRDFLAQHAWLQSMSAAGNCYDNAFAESFFASLKAECFPPSGSFPSHQAAQRALFDHLATFYNRSRLHSSLGYKTPHSVLSSHTT